MLNLIAAAAFFVLLHLLVSGTRLRGALVGAIGEGPYMGLFSLASVGALAWLIVAFAAARGGAGMKRAASRDERRHDVVLGKDYFAQSSSQYSRMVRSLEK